MSQQSVQAFCNRLKKNEKQLGKWARKNGITALRVFDRDIPEVPLRVERYGDEVVVWIYDSAKLTPQFVDVLLDGLRETLSPSQLHVKQRNRQFEGTQYEKLDGDDREFAVTEYGCSFGVNLQKYLDTGLFLDHRDTRFRVQQEASGKRLLNLFCYTGAFSIHAAVGGAKHTTSVDLSKTYLTWTQRNFARNDVDNAAFTTKPQKLHDDGHWLVHQDTFAFLRDAAAANLMYDLVVLDPPTMSKSKRMDGSLDVQRDHVELIEGVGRLLADDGVLYFSNNYKGFELDEQALSSWTTKEITPGSLPKDIRDVTIHRCFRMHR